MNEILFVLPLEGNNHGVLSSSYNTLASDMRQRGWKVSMTSPNEDDFFLKILTNGKNEHSVLFLGHFFSDLRITAQNHFRNTNIADLVRCPIVIKIGDHPFSKFMWERISNTHERPFLFASEPGFFEVARCLQPKLKNFHSLSPPISYAPSEETVSFNDRPIDLLVPMTVTHGNSIDQILAALPEKSTSRKLAEAAYENLRDNRTEYPLTILRNLMNDLFSRDLPTMPDEKDLLLSTFNLFSEIENCIRMERRSEYLTQLLQDVRSQKVLVIDKGFPESLKTEDVTIQPPVDAISLGRLMGQSKMVAHCHPTYPNGLHERIINGMASGCVVISDYAPSLEATFTNYRELIWTNPIPGLNEIVAGLQANQLSEIAKNAYDRAWAEFSPRKHMDQVLQAMSLPT